MKKQTILYIIYLLGCFLLGFTSYHFGGFWATFFVVGLVIVTNPLIHNEMIDNPT